MNPLAKTSKKVKFKIFFLYFQNYLVDEWKSFYENEYQIMKNLKKKDLVEFNPKTKKEILFKSFSPEPDEEDETTNKVELIKLL